MERVGLQFGLMSSLGRFVGDSPLMTLVLYAVLPLLLSHLPDRVTLAALVTRLFERKDTCHSVRTITYKAGDNMSSQESEETSTERNNILQKAIRLYINKNRDRLDIRDAELYMLQSRQMPEASRRNRTKKIGCIDDASLKKLMGYQIAKGPKANKWLLVDPDKQIEFRYFANERPVEDPIPDAFSGKGSGKGAPIPRDVTTTFQLRCCAPDAQNALDNFVEEALEYYKSLRAAAIDTSRYFFMPRGASAARSYDDDFYGKGFGKGSASGRSYKKYVLSEHKTFESIFFPEKADVIRLLDDFAHAKGKFSTPGFPNKLGVLLHGPPGTGKTSLIKSIAQYTKRHIVEVPLTKVKTNQELFDSMFDLVFPVPGEDEAIQMDFKDIVFVLEDVDAASEVVQDRKLCESSSEGSDTGHQILGSMSGKGKGKSSVFETEQAQSKRKGKGGTSGAEGGWEKQEDDDVLNLAGLLNVLDGVVDSPGRIVIMTTNHPEKLDPALIRPGRVNLSLELGYMKSHELVQIVEHIMRTELSPAHHELAAEIARRQCLTAAMVEQSCGETDSLDKLFEKLSLLASCNRRDTFDAQRARRSSSPPSSASTFVDVHSSSGSSHSTSRSPSPA